MLKSLAIVTTAFVLLSAGIVHATINQVPVVPTESAIVTQAPDDTVTTTPKPWKIPILLEIPKEPEAKASEPPPAAPTATPEPVKQVEAPKPAPAPVAKPFNASSQQYVNLMLHYAPNLGENTARRYVTSVVSNSTKVGLDPLWIIAMMWQESNFDVRSTSSESAIGLLQILPSTGKALGYTTLQLRDPEMNIEAGVGYLATLKGNLGDIKKATTAYNQGTSRVRNGTARMWYYNEVYQKYLDMKGWVEQHG